MLFGRTESRRLAAVAGPFAPLSHTHGWGDITGTPTILAGYGISDNKANFNTALSDGSFLYVGDADDYQFWQLNIGVGQTNITAGFALEFVGANGIDVTYSTGVVTIDGSSIADEFVNAATFAVGTGVLALGRAIGADITVDLDGRYEPIDAAIVKSDVEETITEDWTFANDVILNDNKNLFFGTGSDWRAHFDGLDFILVERAITSGSNFIIKNGLTTKFTFDIDAGTLATTSFIENGEFLANKYAPKSPAIITKTASDTLIASDNGKVILFNTGSSVNLTMGLSLGAGFNVQVINIHPTGVVTLLAGSATLNAKAAKLSSQWGGCTIFYTATSTAVALGDLTVA